MTAIKVMMVVFFTSLADGHDTRRISARVSRRKRVVRLTKFSPPAVFGGFRSRRAPGFSETDPVASFSSSLIETVASFKIFTWQGYQDSNPDFRFWRPTC